MEKEENLLSTTNSRKLYFPIYSMSILLLLIVAFLKFKGFTLDKMAVWAIALFIFLGICGTEIHRLKCTYKITPNSVVHIEGYFSKVAKRVDLFAISDVDVSQTLWQRILNFGNVWVHLFSAESTTLIKDINNPKEFALILENQMSKTRKKGRKNA